MASLWEGEGKTERSAPKIGGSGAERGAGVTENDGAGGRGAGMKREAS